MIYYAGFGYVSNLSEPPNRGGGSGAVKEQGRDDTGKGYVQEKGSIQSPGGKPDLPPPTVPSGGAQSSFAHVEDPGGLT